MSKKWTDESARFYVSKVQNGRNQIGLTYYSAVDYLTNHSSSKIEKHPLAEKDENVEITEKKKNGHTKPHR